MATKVADHQNQNPEQRARDQIDRMLVAANWVVQDWKQINLGESHGIAVREHPTDTGPADYILFVDRKAVGVIEAKKDETILTAHEDQTLRYAQSQLKWRMEEEPLPFLFEATSQVIHFTDGRDPAPRAREIFHFFKPETLAEWTNQTDSLRMRLANDLPELPTENLRDCQISAITGLEKSLADNHPRALIQMATGSGKTFTAITAIYRLLKFAGAKRILFLVDTRNLGKQAFQEFHAYTPPDDKRFFPELHNVQRLSSNTIDAHAEVCISTIQRMYSILSGHPIDESAEDIPLAEVQTLEKQPKLVQYNASVPVENFDFIVIDECHRSIYNLWKQVLDYFDATLIGLTATPDKRTFGFFNENVVAEYSYEQSVIDGVNVGYDVYLIETNITKKGGDLQAKEWVDHRNRLTRKKRWAQTEDEKLYTGKELDRSVVNPSQIRHVIKAMKEAVESRIFPSRNEVPKTLIFAKTDSHADDIIQMVREVYGEGNAFCKKVTYKAEEDVDTILSNFRNDYYPRIAVTVDMIATGTDVKPLEILLFMRDVRSKGYYEQMKGRGVRSLSKDGLKNVSNSAETAKTRFVLIDAVGVEKSMKTESRPLERKPGIAMKDLLQGVAMGHRDDDTIQSLANRLIRLSKELDERPLKQIGEMAGKPVQDIAKGLLGAMDPDKITAAALLSIRKEDPTRSEENLSESELQTARDALVQQACLVFDDPKLRDSIESARREMDQIIDHINLDQLTFTGFSEQAEDEANKVIANFAAFIEANKDEIEALSFFYQQPFKRRALTYEMIEVLHDALSRPPLMLTTERLWGAYARVQGNRVKGASLKRQITDIISLVRFATGKASELKPFSDEVDARFKKWIFRHNAQRKTSFSNEQTEWLRLIKDHIAASGCIERDSFDYSIFADKGGLQKVWDMFGNELDNIMDEMNRELVA